MNNLLKFFFIVSVFCCISCNNEYKKQAKEWEQQRQAEKVAKQARLQQYADSTVSLSFMGIELGKPFYKTVQQARNKGSIYALSYKNNRTSATCKAKVNLPNRDKALEVDVLIASYQDTITSFVVMSKDYDTREALKSLYKSKYNEDYSTSEETADYWGDKVQRSVSNSLVWTFKNQSLRYTTFLTEKRENYVKNPEMRSPENRYGVKYTNYFEAISIIYTDFYHSNKVEAYEAELKKEEERKKEIERKKQAKADSIKRAEQKQKAESQDI